MHPFVCEHELKGACVCNKLRLWLLQKDVIYDVGFGEVLIPSPSPSPSPHLQLLHASQNASVFLRGLASDRAVTSGQT